MAKKTYQNQNWEGYIDIPLNKEDKAAVKKLYDNPDALFILFDEWLVAGYYRLGVGYNAAEGNYRCTITGLEGSLFPNKSLVGYGSSPTKAVCSAFQKLIKIKNLPDPQKITSPDVEDFA